MLRIIFHHPGKRQKPETLEGNKITSTREVMNLAKIESV